LDLHSSSLENIRNLRKQKLRELLFPSFGVGHERILYGGKVTAFLENNEAIGYYINKDLQILDFYVKKEFDTFADTCFEAVVDELGKPVFTVRSDDSLLINLVFNYFIDLEKGDYLFVRDRRHNLSDFYDPSVSFSSLSKENFQESWDIVSQEESFFYNGCDPSQKEMFKNYTGKDIFYCLINEGKVRSVGYHQVVRNNCAELGVIVDKTFRNKGLATLLLAELVRLIESKGYQCFRELSGDDITGRKLLEKLGFYVIAKYFIATIKGKVESNNMKKRFRRYSLAGSLKVL